MFRFEPKFEFDDVGRVYCTSHPDLPLFIENRKTPLPIYQSKRLYTCKTCNHFKSDDCIFSRKEIKKIRLGVKLHIYRCEICGGNIERMFNIIYKKKLEKKKGVSIPLLCCSCIIDFAADDVINAFKSRRNTAFILSISFLSISFLFLLIFHWLLYQKLPILLYFIMQLGFSGFMLISSMIFLRIALRLTKSIKNSPLIINLIKKSK